MKIKKCSALVLAIILTLTVLCSCAPKQNGTKIGYFVEYNINAKQLYIDGKTLSLSDYNELVKEAGDIIRAIEKEISLKFSDSDISRINSAGQGESVQVGEHTYRMLVLSKELFALTGGKFSPALFNLSELWGFTPEFEGKYNISRKEPSYEKIQTALLNCNLNDLILLDNYTVQKTNAQLKFDLGGIAKGYMSDVLQAFVQNKFLGKKVEGSITVMSNSVLLGRFHESETETRAWRVNIENPRSLTTDKSVALRLPSVENCAITTSSDMYRFYVYGGKIYSHIIDTATGKPADNGIISITVTVPLAVQNSGAIADALSTSGFCMKLTDALDFYNGLSENLGVSAVIICSDFNYFTIGSLTVENLSEASNGNYEDIFTKEEISEANDEVSICEQEREYILAAGDVYD